MIRPAAAVRSREADVAADVAYPAAARIADDARRAHEPGREYHRLAARRPDRRSYIVLTSRAVTVESLDDGLRRAWLKGGPA
jgi:hypothetical protein